MLWKQYAIKSVPLNTAIQPYRRTTACLPHHLPKARRHLPNTIGLQPSPYILNADKKAAMTLLGKWFWKQFNKVLRMRACLVAQRKEKERRLCKRYRYGLGKDVLCSALFNGGCRDTQHPTWRPKETRFFSENQVVGRQKPAHHQD